MPVEILPVKQWFVNLLDKKELLLVQNDKMQWHPEFMKKRYDNWVSGLEWDWSISRNRHFGIPIPAWECEKCKELIVPEENELPLDPMSSKRKCKKYQ